MSLGGGDVRAQAQPPSQPAAAKKPNVPLQVQVVMSRYQGEKKISSVPYMLSVNTSAPPGPIRPSQLKMGSMVPIMSPAGANERPTSEGATGAPAAGRSFNYQNIGTQIDCSAMSTDDGRFEVYVAIEDNSIYVDDQVVKGVSKGSEPPILRSFRSSNQVILRDGQSTQFTAATDRISGEVIRVDVTLNIVK
jgi:hypothetical protein